MVFSLLRRTTGLSALGLTLAVGTSLAALPALADQAATTATDKAAPAADATAAATPAPLKTIDAPAPVQATLDKLTNGSTKILKAFEAPNGLIGLAVTMGPQKNAILYATPDGKYMMQGMIFDADGQNLTQIEAQQVLPQPPGAAENFASLDKTHSFVWGKASASKEMWILFDPNCIYCHKTYEALKPAVKAGKVKVHVIQAGFLKQDSLAKAAAILSAKDPAAALATDEEKFDEAKEEGAIKGDTSNADAVAEVKKNNEWMQAQGIGGTPYILFKDSDGKPQEVKGYDSDIDGLLAKIGTAS
ncbi:thiol:disulfide interchange protein DsbG [Thioclava sp. BHET1]|uniref:Thiol:disulfide interchange protein n=1 Tax=Thioclava dalianensis TaxID=1185766 RepID=A0A074THQ6_9RHOB|nr:dihydroneopterin aldolase [Thioclava dalianensis]TMV86788.1 thiol:disulfide interchange protein DsbG [Thioclava sp. BHET1]SFN58391.1 thiol:disulfide interchange protein DsbG [Thioclava dalianensis]